MAARVVTPAQLEKYRIGDGLTLIQHPVSPFCIGMDLLLRAAQTPYTLHNVELWDRRPVIDLTAGDYHAIPVLVDARSTPPKVVYEARDDGQDIGRYLDDTFGLGVFPSDVAGLHEIIVQYIEGQIEDTGFRANDAYFLPSMKDQVESGMYVRHKERKFGKGCLEQWREQAPQLRARMRELLVPLDQMLGRSDFLLRSRPVYADYALFGVLGNYAFTGQHPFPENLPHLSRWHRALPDVQLW